jgi:FkbM family methyltransferase
MERRIERPVQICGGRELVMEHGFVFDQPHYRAMNEARGEALRLFLLSVEKELTLRSAVDVGCGLGYFSALLRGFHLDVLGLDSRAENIEEARTRVLDAKFRLADAEDSRICSFGKFDLALCFGLLYHLENPFAAIRNLFALTGKIAIVEGMCLPGSEPILGVREEGPTEDQGMRHIALYPTENALVKLLYRSGFPFVYRFRNPPGHPDFRSSRDRKQTRTMLAASTVPIKSDMVVLVAEPAANSDPWTIETKTQAIRHGFARARRFLKKPTQEKARSVFFRWVRIFPGVPVPVRLPYGGWWLARNDFLGAALFYDGFENTERSFVERFLRPGMTMLDIGAHHGYYTLLASRKVGPSGLVLAVEPSPRERKRLRLHLRMNRCKNVQVESRALGEAEGTAELYLVRGSETGCNSLRAPNIAQDTERLSVSVECLDRVLQDHGIEHVDLIKLDVEGAELSALRGARQLLSKQPRPVILTEVQEIRTRPWGYRALEIVRYLSSANYRWFRPLPNGSLERLDATAEEYDGNFVAIPEERVAALGNLISDSSRGLEASDSRAASSGR